MLRKWQKPSVLTFLTSFLLRSAAAAVVFVLNKISLGHIPNIIISAHDEAQARTKALACGASAYIKKWPAFSEVISQIRNLLAMTDVNKATHNAAVHGQSQTNPVALGQTL